MVHRRVGITGLSALLVFMIGLSRCYAEVYNGFALDEALIPPDQIYAGGPPRDGIPAIDNPQFVEPERAGFLSSDSRVLGLVVNGEAKAYPISILNWHEVVNDSIGGEAVVISFCPLCGTGVVYSALVEGRRLSFGVSGLLYNSDVLLYDRETESLWSQLMSQAVAGPMAGRALTRLPVQLTHWGDWRSRYPDSPVLSTETGYRRDYRRDPYGGYETSGAVYFPVAFLSQRYHPKERVLGLEYGGEVKAYPFAELAKAGPRGELTDEVAGEVLRIRYDAARRSGQISTARGDEIAVINAFWFAWYAFNPATLVYEWKPR